MAHDGSKLQKYAESQYSRKKYRKRIKHDLHFTAIKLSKKDNKTEEDWYKISNLAHDGSKLQKYAESKYSRKKYRKRIKRDLHSTAVEMCSPA